MIKPKSVEVGQRWHNGNGLEFVVEHVGDSRSRVRWNDGTATDPLNRIILDGCVLLSSPTPAPVSPFQIDWGEACDRLSGPAPVSVRTPWAVGQRRRGQFGLLDMDPYGSEYNFVVVRRGQQGGCDWMTEIDGLSGQFGFKEAWPNTLLAEAPTSPQPSPVACGHIKRGDILNRQCVLPAGHDGDHRDPPSPVATTPNVPVAAPSGERFKASAPPGGGETEGIYGRAVGEMRALDGSPKTALDAIQARKKPEPWVPSCDEDFWIPDAGT